MSFFVLEIFTFLNYANEESDDVIGGATKTVQHSVKNISRNIKAVFFKLGTKLKLLFAFLLTYHLPLQQEI